MPCHVMARPPRPRPTSARGPWALRVAATDEPDLATAPGGPTPCLCLESRLQRLVARLGQRVCPRQGPAQSSAPAGAPHQEEGEGREVGDSREGRKKGREEGPPGWGVSGPWPSPQAPLLARLGGHALCGPPPPVGPLPAASNDVTVSRLQTHRSSSACESGDGPFKTLPSQTERSYTEDAGHTGWGGGSFLPSAGKQPSLVSTSTGPPWFCSARFPASVLAQLP